MGMSPQRQRRPRKRPGAEMQARYQKIGRRRCEQVTLGSHTVVRDGDRLAGLFQCLPHFGKERQVGFGN